MSRLEMRLIKLEQRSIPPDQMEPLIVQFVDPGHEKEIHQLKAYGADFMRVRITDETEKQFLERTKTEAIRILKPIQGCAIALLSD